ncbi:hypothetical protein GQ457_09G003730 [Hibiscus cannabinus]
MKAPRQYLSLKPVVLATRAGLYINTPSHALMMELSQPPAAPFHHPKHHYCCHCLHSIYKPLSISSPILFFLSEISLLQLATTLLHTHVCHFQFFARSFSFLLTCFSCSLFIIFVQTRWKFCLTLVQLLLPLLVTFYLFKLRKED